MSTYREIPFGYSACTVCDQIIEWLRSRDRPKLKVHGPRGNHCSGSHERGRPWREASGLPSWEEMCDLDKGAALLHVWKRHWEGAGYAREEYPAEYITDPVLRGLPRWAACRHAAEVCGRHEEVRARLGDTEHDRLYDLALKEGQEILDSRKRWGIRYEHGSVLTIDEAAYAHRLITELNAVELLHRDTDGGAWSIVVDARGTETRAELSRTRPGDVAWWDGEWRHVASNTVVYRDFGEHGRNVAVRVVTFVDGLVVEEPPYWITEGNREAWITKVRRRTTVPDGARR